MITEDTVPYTDLKGYRHIGGFPYGANLVLSGAKLVSTTSPSSQTADTAKSVIDAKAEPNESNVTSTAATASNGNVSMLSDNNLSLRPYVNAEQLGQQQDYRGVPTKFDLDLALSGQGIIKKGENIDALAPSAQNVHNLVQKLNKAQPLYE